jgi:NAD(P)-dependent dehydrogenase (short-subunit alcohol dehydrogenase family)
VEVGDWVGRLDVRSADDWRAVLTTATERFGGLDVLANIAGVGGDPAGVEDCDLSDWADVLATNQTGTMLGMRAAIPAMRDRGGGSIVNVSSLWATQAVPGWAAYHASKAPSSR